MASRRGAVGAGLARLLVLGVAFHALYVLSIFDIYFTSPVVPHVESVAYTDAPPAKRVLVFVADGCRADKFFEANASRADARAEPRASFLRNIIETRGSYGVSHTRVPTESRPGHVALFAGMYEDVSAVTKGWADNPVDFDSVFNQSSSSFLFGSPDIVPMFARQVSHAHEEHYSHEEEDFAKGDSSELDVWVFRHLQKLLDGAKEGSRLFEQLHDEGVVIFCHYLGIDSNGHAHRPNSKDYLNNIKLVDELVEKTYRMVEEFFGYDGRTAYVFTADHGMGLKGAHGDGDPANTRTPLVVWGAGVQGPMQVEKGAEFEIDLPTQSRAQVRAQLQAQEEQEQAAVDEWGALNKLLRKDVMQADVAPLISALLGLPYPRNSVGVLPFSYLAKGAYRANAVRSNAQQLYLHALRKEQEKRARTLLRFVPYGPFRDRVPELSKQLAEAYDASLQSDEDLEAYARVEVLSQELIEICLATLEYFQSIAYEVLFYVVLCGVLVSWLLLEAEASMTSSSSIWREVQRAFVFLLLVNIAFFGTGNVASMSSFEISSTYRFVTVFAPFTMGALLVGKILIPFMVVACTFHLILLLPSASSSPDTQKPRLPATRYFLLVVAMSDMLALHFLFLVKNEGSWKEIGNSISMFGIVNAQIVFIPLLFLLARAFVRDLAPATEIGGPKPSRQEAPIVC
ncbi:putative GPI ethanolamine phosphate transferase [Phytophthora cinnamomi]|uniref:putative GPI ethanolamine phosphate transferase n=1 Tax=Phytophthora cinnamomi TaxID=4785 RepID=UPI00355A4491|nr:putative GPI ethanolamine phosphate transferase [Phytophthora cinnamomi]